MNKAKVVCLMLLVLTVNFSFFGDKKKIVFWDENAGPDRTPYLLELIKRFHEKNHDIEVEYVGLQYSGAKQKIDLAVAGGAVPDCSGMSTNWLSDLIIKEALIPLDSFFKTIPDKDKYIPSQIEGIKELAFNKRIYMLPMTTNINLFWYRPDWFKESGINPPVTWDEFFSAVKKLTDKSKNRYGFSIRGGAQNTENLEKMIWAYSGASEYFDKNGKCLIRDPLHIEFLKKLAALYNVYTPENDITSGYKEIVEKFNNGTVAMIMHNLGSYVTHQKYMKPKEFAALILPRGKSGKFSHLGTTLGYSVYKGTKYPKEAFKFISFLTSKESMSYWNKSIGQLPVRSDIMNEAWIKEAQHYQVSLKNMKDKNFTVVKFPVYLPDYSAIRKALEQEFQNLLVGKKSAEEFVEIWASLFEKSEAEYNKKYKK